MLPLVIWAGSNETHVTKRAIKFDSQGFRHKHPIPNMTPGTMSEIVAKACKFYAADVTLCDVQLGLVVLEVVYHEASEISNTCKEV